MFRRDLFKGLGAALLLSALPRPAIVRAEIIMPVSPPPLLLLPQLPCNGQSISILDYERLFKLIGFNYGAGESFGEFRVPAILNTSILTGIADPASTGYLASGSVLHAEPIVERGWHDERKRRSSNDFWRAALS